MHSKAIITKTVWYWTRGRKDQIQTHTSSVTCDLLYVKGNIFAVCKEKTFFEKDAESL